MKSAAIKLTSLHPFWRVYNKKRLYQISTSDCVIVVLSNWEQQSSKGVSCVAEAVWASCCFSDWVLWRESIKKGGEIIDTFPQHCYKGSSLSVNSVNFSDLLLLLPCLALYMNNPIKGLLFDGCEGTTDCLIVRFTFLPRWQSPFLSLIYVKCSIENFTVSKDMLIFIFTCKEIQAAIVRCFYIFRKK